MTKLSELCIAALLGAVVAAITGALLFGRWQSEIENRISDLDSGDSDRPGRVTVLERSKDSISMFPDGSVLAWDPVVRVEKNEQSADRLPIPEGWVICGTTTETVNLDGRFIRGSSSRIEAGKTGGNDTIAESGLHKHSGNTDVKSGGNRKPGCEGKCNPPVSTHSHGFTTSENGTHGHGSNSPSYTQLVFLCKN